MHKNSVRLLNQSSFLYHYTSGIAFFFYSGETWSVLKVELISFISLHVLHVRVSWITQNNRVTTNYFLWSFFSDIKIRNIACYGLYALKLYTLLIKSRCHVLLFDYQIYIKIELLFVNLNYYSKSNDCLTKILTNCVYAR